MAINKGQLFDAVHGISEFQIKHLEKMIPEPFKQIWHKGIEGDLFRLKICGAGGGGFILGITTDFEKLTALLPSYKLIKLKATNENRPILKQYGPIL
jgi:mevalonate kinase